ncbi:hypothetical protein BU23DRAFT_540797 [Bimuria novae-zelandiae CBS 107.79]|uniref:PD-(D/E)XK nuclease-like domain-containing protein n=1 Tax=Bimuria novae-zelandiae CBS 107.79 TaxID=1447943 RepID=A0A6A5UVE8_9PLEO|nr:hypothetical protein BU23DRAFT_540797 [Bimuria novae-zelandiae CBS 107.79]
MASMFLSSSTSRIQRWLCDSPDTVSPRRPPSLSESLAAAPPRLVKRRRDTSPCDMEDSSSRGSSPGKRRRQNNDNLSMQSISQSGSIAVSDRTVLTAPASAKRSTSPSRYLTQLRTARPPISLSPITMPPPLPDKVKIRLGKLRRRLGDTVKGAYIPAGLKKAIEQDPEFHLSLSMEPIDPEAFDYDDKRTLADFSLAYTIQQVKSIFRDATLCTQFGRDENAWCFGVVWPLIELAIKLHGKDKWRPESVQSQTINPLYLSRISDPSTPTKERPLFRKTDFCFSYSYLDPHFRAFYDQLDKVQSTHASHTTDNFTARSILFSGIEVKPENGDQKEAELQMSIWMAASLRKKMELVRKAFPTTSVSETDITSDSGVGYNANEQTIEDPIAPLPPSPTALLEPALTVIGHEHKVYYACISSAVEDGNIAILGPDEKFTNLSTRSVQGIFKLIKFYAGILDYGYGADRESEHKGKEELWGEYIGRIARAVSAMV